MSAETSTHESNEDADMLCNLIKDLQFLKYAHSIEQIKPSGFSFPADTEYSEVHDFSKFGMDVIKDFLHIGLVIEDELTLLYKRNQILLLVWPPFVSPTVYGDHKVYLPGLKKIKILIFRVSESVYFKYFNDSSSLNDLISAAAVLTPKDDWKLLEGMVIASFYHFTFDKPTTDAHGNINVWQNFSKDKLEKGWRQLLFLCCGPQGLAYLVKRMLMRNWAKIARKATSMDITSDNGYSVFCTGSILQLLIKWAKSFHNHDLLLKFLKECNSAKPALSPINIMQMAQLSFEQHAVSSDKHRCSTCPFESHSKHSMLVHNRVHTGEKPFICDACKMTFRCRSLLKDHEIRRHTGKYPYQCKYCGKPYMAPSQLKYHLSVHKKRDDLQFRCHKCSLIFEDETMLTVHMSSHSDDPTFDCTVCYKKLDSETALSSHSRIHDEEKPFNCSICGRGFGRKWEMTKHYNIHSESRALFRCSFCHKEFKTALSKRRHEVGTHEDQIKG